MKRTYGYALINADEHYNDAFWAKIPPDGQEWLRSLQSAVPNCNPQRYRGIARDLLWGLPPLPKGDSMPLVEFHRLFSADPSDPLYEARVRYGEIEYSQWHSDDHPDDDDGLLLELAGAREVLALIHEPAQYEIVRHDRVDLEVTKSTLGFDIGYWGGDHYSILADSVIRPVWHPPATESFEALRAALGSLNENALFPTPEAALAFRHRYIEFEWAERESGDDGSSCSPFEPIRISYV